MLPACDSQHDDLQSCVSVVLRMFNNDDIDIESADHDYDKGDMPCQTLSQCSRSQILLVALRSSSAVGRKR